MRLGIDRDNGQEEPLLFQDRGKYAELMAITNTQRIEMGEPSRSDQGYSSFRDVRTPCLVSFVGQTGAGKSALIKLIIDLNTGRGPENTSETFPSPVVGIPGHHIPTSEDVHLYLDPPTATTEAPVLYADCEGLDGGETEPLGTTNRKRRRISIPQTNSSDESSFRARYNSERVLAWADSSPRRTRHFTVSNLYPRLLFTFSDVIVFVLRNPR
jgi:energy-coupling factor transporter ATP-binding protein EcfA2